MICAKKMLLQRLLRYGISGVGVWGQHSVLLHTSYIPRRKNTFKKSEVSHPLPGRYWAVPSASLLGPEATLTILLGTARLSRAWAQGSVHVNHATRLWPCGSRNSSQCCPLIAPSSFHILFISCEDRWTHSQPHLNSYCMILDLFSVAKFSIFGPKVLSKKVVTHIVYCETEG